MKSKYFYLIIILILASIIINSIVFALEWRVLTRIDEMYDDNIRSSSNNKEDDFITNLMLGINLKHESLNERIDVNGHVYQQFFFENKNLNYNYQDLTINYNKQFSTRDNIIINETFNHYPEPQDFATMFGRPQGKYSYYLNNINFVYIKNLSRLFTSNIHYSNIIIVSSDQELLNNSLSNSAGLALDFSLTSSTVMYFYYDYTNKRYETKKEINNKGYNEFIIHDIELGLQHYITNQLYTLLKGGMQSITSPNDTNYSPIITLSIIQDIDLNNTLRISASKRQELAILSDIIYNSLIFSANFRRQISTLFAVSITAFYNKGKSKSTAIENTRSLLGANTSFNYYLSEKTYIDFNYIYTRNEYKEIGSGDGHLKYDRNQIRVALTSEF